VDRFTWAVVAGAVLLVLVAVGSVAVLQSRTVEPDLSTPEGVVRAYYAALQEGRPDRAWDLLSSTAKAGTTREEFIRRATGFTPGFGARITFDSVETEGDTAVVRLSRNFGGGGLFGSSGGGTPITVRLDREGGAWRITVPPDPFLIQAPPR
jgi:hypothetical protein